MPSARAGAGEMLLVNGAHACCRCDLARRALRDRDLRQSEVENLGVTALGDENVGGLDVAVDDAFGVGRVERVGDLDAQIGRIVSSSTGCPRCDASA